MQTAEQIKAALNFNTAPQPEGTTADLMWGPVRSERSLAQWAPRAHFLSNRRQPTKLHCAARGTTGRTALSWLVGSSQTTSQMRALEEAASFRSKMQCKCSCACMYCLHTKAFTVCMYFVCIYTQTGIHM